jgi:hypothetical protein
MFILSFVPIEDAIGIDAEPLPADLAAEHVLSVTAVAQTMEDITAALIDHLRGAYPEVPPSDIILTAREKVGIKPFTAVRITRNLPTTLQDGKTEYMGSAAITEIEAS